MKTFESLESARNYYDDKLGKYERVHIIADGKHYILGGTPLAIDEEIEDVVYNALRKILNDLHHIDLDELDDRDDYWDFIGTIRDSFFDKLQEFTDTEYEYVTTNY